MSNRVTPAAKSDAEAESSSSASSALAGPSKFVPPGKLQLQYFSDFNENQLNFLANQLGQWEIQTSCVRKDCTHQPQSLCWEQDVIYPINTKQPSFYLPRLIQRLPASLSNNRQQWMYTCLLAKHYRMPVNLCFSAIKPYTNRIKDITYLGRKRPLELDAYSLCLIYTAGSFIDKRGLLLERLGFLEPYPSEHHNGFEWKFAEKRDRLFRQYGDGHWEEDLLNDEQNGAIAGSHALVLEVKLIYSRFMGLAHEGRNMNDYQKDVAKALIKIPPMPDDDADVPELHATQSEANSETARGDQNEAANMKRKFEDTLEELSQQKEQYSKLMQDSKKERFRSNKRQKLLYNHIESIYHKEDTRKMLFDDANSSDEDSEVAMELKDSYSTWVNSVKPQFDRERSGT